MCSKTRSFIVKNKFAYSLSKYTGLFIVILVDLVLISN